MEIGRTEIIREMTGCFTRIFMSRINGELRDNILEEMSRLRAEGRINESLESYIGRVLAGMFVSFESLGYPVDQKKIDEWADEKIPKFKKFFRSSVPRKVMKDQGALSRIIFEILYEFLSEQAVTDWGEDIEFIRNAVNIEFLLRWSPFFKKRGE